MARYKRKSIEVDALSFEEFIQLGLKLVDEKDLINGMPWSFKVNGCAVTHEEDDHYIISTPDEDGITLRSMTPDHMLIMDHDSVYPVLKSHFDKLYTEM